MYKMREGWTDERLDDFRDDVNRRFDKVDSELARVNDRLDSMHKMLVYAVITLGSSTVAGWAAVIVFVVTRT